MSRVGDGKRRKATKRRAARQVLPRHTEAAAAGQDVSSSPERGPARGDAFDAAPSAVAPGPRLAAAQFGRTARPPALPARDVVLRMATAPGRPSSAAGIDGSERTPLRPVRDFLELLQGTLRLRSDSEVPTIPGTSFTEQGVETALAWLPLQLQTNSANLRPAQLFVARIMYGFLTAPPRDGQTLVAGANLDNLKRLEAMLKKGRTGDTAVNVPAAALTPAPAPSDYRASVARFYDGTIKGGFVNRLLFEGSEYSNFGYWRADTVTPGQACDNLMEEILRYIPEKKGRILDVACGKGATTRYLCKYYEPSSVFAINISKEQLRKCEENAPGCTFLEMDATAMELPDSSFDNIICVEAAFHFDTRETFLAQAHRVLKAGGRLVMADMLLPRGAANQPEANVVDSLDAYQAVFRRAKFVDIEIVDVTEACVGGRFEHLGRTVRERLPRVAARPQLLNRFARELDNLWSDRTYVLVSCTKPNTGAGPARAKGGSRVSRRSAGAVRASVPTPTVSPGLPHDPTERAAEQQWLASIVEQCRPIDGWLADAEASLLARAVRQAVRSLPDAPAVVEIGSFCGKSTVALGLALRDIKRRDLKIYAIDPHASFLPTLESLRHNIGEAGLQDLVVVVQKLSFEVEWARPICFLFIDGLHDYHNVARDFDHFERWVVPGGYVAFHDYSDQFPGVKRLVDEVLRTGRYRLVEQAVSAIVVEKVPGSAMR